MILALRAQLREYKCNLIPLAVFSVASTVFSALSQHFQSRLPGNGLFEDIPDADEILGAGITPY